MPETGKFEGNTHIYPLRVYYGDTDAAGIVYYANYLRFAEAARGEMINMLGWERDPKANAENTIPKQEKESIISFAVRHCEISYEKASKLSDALHVHTNIVKVGGASLTLRQDIIKEGELMVAINLTLVAISPDVKPIRIPKALRDKMETMI
ncbi:MAG: YbgC/FadM family acyl-CoA thioesterase [Alphaproteobacteria bacterium]|nr:YbgC/FadM family acyl-CoA thioesterase [Alphaproteobacteria bacterium]